MLLLNPRDIMYPEKCEVWVCTQVAVWMIYNHLWLKKLSVKTKIIEVYFAALLTFSHYLKYLPLLCMRWVLVVFLLSPGPLWIYLCPEGMHRNLRILSAAVSGNCFFRGDIYDPIQRLTSQTQEGRNLEVPYSIKRSVKTNYLGEKNNNFQTK